MRIGVPISACILCMAAWFAPWGIEMAAGEPSKPCLDLASRFANTPQGMDVVSLARLGNCISVEIEARLGGTEPSAAPPAEAPPPAAPEANPSPPSAAQPEPSSPPVRQRFTWPPPAPWIDNWPPQASWDK